MMLPWFLVLLSLCGVAASLLLPGASDWILLSLPSLLASLILLIRARLAQAPALPAVIVDGSNVMHWRDNTPQIETLREVIAALEQAGFAPGVVFDANAGYKLTGRYLHDDTFSSVLGLPRKRVIVVNKGEPADPLILTAARDHGARIVTNDRFRDWVGQFPDVTQADSLIKGGYRDGKLWLDI